MRSLKQVEWLLTFLISKPQLLFSISNKRSVTLVTKHRVPIYDSICYSAFLFSVFHLLVHMSHKT